MPIIAVSGAMALIDDAHLKAAGFAAALGKPVRLSTLIDLVRQHAPQWSARQINATR
jgi:CheY-like chemotaxis protein